MPTFAKLICRIRRQMVHLRSEWERKSAKYINRHAFRVEMPLKLACHHENK
jgi:hypothetical protein